MLFLLRKFYFSSLLYSIFSLRSYFSVLYFFFLILCSYIFFLNFFSSFLLIVVLFGPKYSAFWGSFSYEEKTKYFIGACLLIHKECMQTPVFKCDTETLSNLFQMFLMKSLKKKKASIWILFFQITKYFSVLHPPVSILLFNFSYFSPKLISEKVMFLAVIFSFGLLYGVHQQNQSRRTLIFCCLLPPDIYAISTSCLL